MRHTTLRFGKKKHVRDVLLSKVSKRNLKVFHVRVRVCGVAST